MMHQINERADYSAEFWSLIHLESELMVARAYLNVLGSLPEGQGMTIIAGWSGYCQQRVKSDPLTATTNGLILIHLVYSGLASAITPAFRFCFSR